MADRQNLGIKAGDTVRVHQKIKDEKGKVRLQVFEGLVLARKHGNEAGATFTVRKVVDGIGVEKIFPLYSPMIDKIEIVKRSEVRRAKLYFIREKVVREIKRQMRRMRLMDASTESEIVAAQRAEEEAKRVAEEAELKAQEELAAKQAEEAKAVESAAVETPEAPEAEETPPQAEEKKE
jgi:large subunit ribosomal protein L19